MTIAFDATIREYLKEIDEAALLTEQQERDLGKRIIEDNDPEAREQMVRSNLRLVVSIAKRYSDRGMSLGDLIEEGNLGLIKAVDYFDPEKGNRFSTYAAWWIKQGIKRALLENIRPVHIPTYMVSLIKHWRHITLELESKLGRSPNIEEVAKVMELPIRKAKVIGQVAKVLSSVRDTSGDDGSDDRYMLRDTLPDKNALKPEDTIVAYEELEKVIRLLNEIDPRQASVLKMHYGLENHKPMTLKEIGKKLGLTRERIRQIQREALTKLYEYMNEE